MSRDSVDRDSADRDSADWDWDSVDRDLGNRVLSERLANPVCTVELCRPIIGGLSLGAGGYSPRGLDRGTGDH